MCVCVCMVCGLRNLFPAIICPRVMFSGAVKVCTLLAACASSIAISRLVSSSSSSIGWRLCVSVWKNVQFGLQDTLRCSLGLFEDLILTLAARVCSSFSSVTLALD